MEFSFKEDWVEARKRLEAWWKGEIIDRCTLMVSAPREGVMPR